MSRIENLGNYNTVRVMLQEKNGDLEAQPKHIRTGILIGAPIGAAGVFAVTQVSNYVKKCKQAKIKEAEPKAELEKALKEEETPFESED